MISIRMDRKGWAQAGKTSKGKVNATPGGQRIRARPRDGNAGRGSAGGTQGAISFSSAPGYSLRMNVTVNGRTRRYRTVTFDSRGNRVMLIEQRLLPHEFKVVSTSDFRATAGAIRDMVVRGAGAIGATAAYGLAQGARAFRGRNLNRFRQHVDQVFQTIKAARP